MATRPRSPNYPGLNLEEAIERVTRVYRAEHTHAVAKIAVLSDLGYTSESGRALGQLGALRAYDLLEGRGDALRVTERAVAIIEFSAEPNNATRIQALRDCALAPTIFREMFEQFGERAASDAAMRHWLIARDFLSKAADEVIQTYRDNLEFLRRLNVGYNTVHPLEAPTTPHPPPPEIEVGDYVQWEPQGVLQFSQPKRVREVSSDGEWAFVEGSNVGVPTKELTIEEAPRMQQEPNRSRLMTEAPTMTGRQHPPIAAGSRHDVFSLPEGPVTIEWPAALRPESYQDLAAWLEIVKRKIGRSLLSKAKILVIDKAPDGFVVMPLGGERSARFASGLTGVASDAELIELLQNEGASDKDIEEAMEKLDVQKSWTITIQ
jgi:hypothetical protein